MKKRIHTTVARILIVFVLLLNKSMPAGMALEPESNRTIAGQCQQLMAAMGIPEGRPITRAEAAVLLVRLADMRCEGSLEGYDDVNPGAWYARELETAVGLGLLRGWGNSLWPDRPVTPRQVSTMLGRLMSYEPACPQDGGTVAPQQFTALVQQQFPNWKSAVLEGSVTGNLLAIDSGVLQDLTVHGDALVCQTEPSYNVMLQDVQVSGRLVLRCSGTVYLVGSTQADQIIVEAGGGEVHVKTYSGCKPALEVRTDRFVATGAYQRIDLQAKNTFARMEDAGVYMANAIADGIFVTVDQYSWLGRVNIPARRVTVAGDGEVELALAYGSEINVATDGTQVVAMPTSSHVWAGAMPVPVGWQSVLFEEERQAALEGDHHWGLDWGDDGPAYGGGDGSGDVLDPDPQPPPEPAPPAEDAVALLESLSSPGIEVTQDDPAEGAVTLYVRGAEVQAGFPTAELAELYGGRRAAEPFAAVGLRLKPTVELAPGGSTAVCWRGRGLKALGFTNDDSAPDEGYAFTVEGDQVVMEAVIPNQWLEDRGGLILPLLLCQGEQAAVRVLWNGEEETASTYTIDGEDLRFLAAGGVEAALQGERGMVIRYTGDGRPAGLLEVLDAAGEICYAQWRLEELPPDVDYVEWDLQDDAGRYVQPGTVLVRLRDGQTTLQEQAVAIGGADLLALLPRGGAYTAEAPYYCGDGDDEAINDLLPSLWGQAQLLRFEGDVLQIDCGQITQELVDQCTALFGRPSVPVGLSTQGTLRPPVEEDTEGAWCGSPILWLDLADWSQPRLEVMRLADNAPLAIISMDGAQ